jgi:hypothetical protein
MKIDYVLVADNSEKRLPTTDGYDWVGIIDAGRWPTLQQGVDLLLFQIQNHADLFEQGGYIEDYDALLLREMAAQSYVNAHDKWDFNQQVIDHLKGVVPGFSHLDHRSDLSLLLSVYGKVCNALPVSARMDMRTVQISDGEDTRRAPEPSLVAKLKAAIAKRNGQKPDGTTSDDVAYAAIGVVDQYRAALEDGHMGLSPERAMQVKWAMLSIKSAIESEFPAGWNPFDKPVLIAMNDAMVCFEDVVEARLGAPVRSTTRAGGRLTLVSDVEPGSEPSETPPGMGV